MQVYAPTTNTEEAEQFCEDPQDLLEPTPKKRCSFHPRGQECKAGSQKILGITGKFGTGVQNEEEQRLTMLPREQPGHST